MRTVFRTTAGTKHSLFYSIGIPYVATYKL